MDRGKAILITENIARGLAAIAAGLDIAAAALVSGEGTPEEVAEYLRGMAVEVQEIVDLV